MRFTRSLADACVEVAEVDHDGIDLVIALEHFDAVVGDLDQHGLRGGRRRDRAAPVGGPGDGRSRPAAARRRARRARPCRCRAPGRARPATRAAARVSPVPTWRRATHRCRSARRADAGSTTAIAVRRRSVSRWCESLSCPHSDSSVSLDTSFRVAPVGTARSVEGTCGRARTRPRTRRRGRCRAHRGARRAVPRRRAPGRNPSCAAAAWNVWLTAVSLASEPVGLTLER